MLVITNYMLLFIGASTTLIGIHMGICLIDIMSYKIGTNVYFGGIQCILKNSYS